MDNDPIAAGHREVHAVDVDLDKEGCWNRDFGWDEDLTRLPDLAQVAGSDIPSYVFAQERPPESFRD